MNKFEKKAHDIQKKKKNRVSGKQLGDDPLFNEIEPVALTWCTILVVFGIVVLVALLS